MTGRMVIGDSSRRDKPHSPAHRVSHSWRHENGWRLRPENPWSTLPTKTFDEDKTAKKEPRQSEVVFGRCLPRNMTRRSFCNIVIIS